jgi:hypothetical protein
MAIRFGHISGDGNQLNNGLREAMLKGWHGKALLIVEALYLLKIAPESWLTFDEIFRLLNNNCGCSYQLVYQGLQDRQVFQRQKTPPRPGQRGARPYEYRLPEAAELEAEFAPGQKPTPSDTLTLTDFRSLTTYRMALHRQLYIRKWCENGGQGFVMSRGLMAERLGVSARTVRTYDQKLNHSHDPNYHWQGLPRYKRRRTKDDAPPSSKQWLEVVDAESGRRQNYPLVKFLAYKALKADCAVFRVERLPNTYYPYSKPDVSQIPSWDAASRYFVTYAVIRAAGFYCDGDGKWYHRRE